MDGRMWMAGRMDPQTDERTDKWTNPLLVRQCIKKLIRAIFLVTSIAHSFMTVALVEFVLCCRIPASLASLHRQR